jgi:hypothetical protein
VDYNSSRAGWDVWVFGIPLLALLFFGFFRLDRIFTSRKKGPGSATRRRPAVVDKTGASMRSDPDGRSWDAPPPPKR